MQQAAEALTDSKNSIQISRPDSDSKRLTARFSMPQARQEDIVDYIGRTFWNYIEDYSDSSIGLGSKSRLKAPEPCTGRDGIRAKPAAHSVSCTAQ